MTNKCVVCDQRGIAGCGLYFHRFPENIERRKLWLNALHMENAKKWKYVCSRHFRRSDYSIKQSGRKMLKIIAIPKPKRLQSERKLYVGDITSGDLSTPTKAKKSFNMAKQKITEYRKKIRVLQRKNQRMTSRLSSLKSLLDMLKKKNLISHMAQESIEVSITHISPWISGDYRDDSGNNSQVSHGQPDKCFRNPHSLFRGAEYQRFYWATNKEPLTYYDMNLSAQDHQNFFTCEADAGKEEFEIMQTAWRERNPQVRIKAAHTAIEKNPDCATAYILLAEEEATTITEAEKILKQAYKIAEANYKKSQGLQGALMEAQHRRDTNVLIYIKRRLAMCARRLGKLKEAVKLFRDLSKEVPPIMNVLSIHENLIEVLLQMQAYADVQAVLARYDEGVLPRSATLLYTAALLKARTVADKFSPDVASKRGLTSAELQAVEAIHRAVEFNPHVPKYLLELKSLILPPEHVLRRGDSEAISYSFFHLAHWKAVDDALNLLQCTWEGTFRMLPYPLERGHVFYAYPTCTECMDKELLPAFHDLSVYPKKELPFFIIFTAGLCSFTALLALLTHQYPEFMGVFAKAVVNWISVPVFYLYEKVENIIPPNLLQQIIRI